MVRDVPLSEITLRKYEKPYDSSARELVRKVCLSLGLLQPGDSRDVVVDILLALEIARKEKKELTSIEVGEIVKKIRKENSLDEKGLAESNIRRQLKKLRDLMLVDKKNNLYRLLLSLLPFSPSHFPQSSLPLYLLLQQVSQLFLQPIYSKPSLH